MNDKIDKIIYDALEEDIPTIDVTTDNIFSDQLSEGVLIAEEDGVLSGIKIMQRVFQILDDEIYIKVINSDATFVEKGDIIAIISGRAKSILKGEQLVLNIIRRMSGIASLTKEYVDEIGNRFTKIIDTRMTSPNLRILEKQAVLDGGGINHRMNLSNQVMLKEKHIKTVGNIKDAVKLIRARVDQSIKIEVVVNNFTQFLDSIHTDCDIIMLENMNNELIRKCVEHNTNKLLEASGNITLERIKSVAETGVDFISVEALTQTYKPLNISLKFN
ncbi:putative nicotinate-nucleotide pyrophosphorylase [Candidatus Izimaplasma bacterium HR1]|jgi:nicotinate-nucleotide pyrophosphorylase (carboxylating)|uniref:carboxylating nicotinate-nucleotide diphosphorylase n=1 Tax=Candidatus Izimoplasma sp. HR1 TaxID=1541959 RepID=UPI0004F79BDA|nr:putative nicotinate-nucleotide pyrophosphorylase [Candidatus Izimaplasma bacterium HR1]